jgi:hypothetical protein
MRAAERHFSDFQKGIKWIFRSREDPAEFIVSAGLGRVSASGGHWTKVANIQVESLHAIVVELSATPLDGRGTGTFGNEKESSRTL